MQFEASVLTADNRMERFQLQAADVQEAWRQAEQRGGYVASVRASDEGGLLARLIHIQGARRLSLVLFSQELLALLNAGLSIVEALEALHEKELIMSTRSLYGALLLGLREGKRLSTVLAEHADLFPPLFVGIVRAAEGTGNLPRSLARFIDYQQRIDLVKSKLISAAIYPSILMVVGSGVSFFLIAFVVPRFADVYQGTGRQLPWLTQTLLDLGLFLSSHALLSLAFISGFLFLGWKLLTQGKLWQWISKIPAVGERARVYQLSRLYLTLGMLIEGGIPMVSAMETVMGIVPLSVARQLDLARKSVAEGSPLSTAFEQQLLTTSISLRMLRVGEKTGDMGLMLTQSAAFYDSEINRWIDRFTRSFEPLLMAAIGLVVGVIVVLLYMPIFDIAGSLS